MTKTNKPKERIIVSSIYDIDDWKDAFNDWCENNDLDKDEQDIYDFIEHSISTWVDDEKANLDIECDGDILAIADLELWNGRFSGYKVIPATRLSAIFNVGMRGIEDYKFYCDQYNVKAELYHHDGCNNIEFRLLRKNVNPQPLLEALYNQKEVTREMIRKYTLSLRPMVATVYGW